MSDAVNTPLVRRAIRRAEWKTFLHRLFDASKSYSQTRAAADIGVSQSKIAQWLATGDESQMPVAEVEALPAPVVVTIVERVLERVRPGGYRVVSTEAPSSLEDDLRVMASLASQGGLVVGHYGRALADGNVSPEEAGEMLPHVIELQRLASTLRHDLEERMKERTSRPMRAVAGGRS